MPQRAPNRDLVERYDGRAADGTVRRHYFRRFNRLERLKWILTGLALLAGGGWLLAGPIGRMLGLDAGGEYRYSHGPLAQVHAAWDANCEACHKPPEGSASPFAVRDRWLNLTCEKCHAAPVHHATMKDQKLKGSDCAECHHDHQGRTNSLVSLTDSHCVSCHGNLPDHTAGGSPQYAKAINSFAADHPEFKVLAEKKHERTIKFSHAAHLAPGAAVAGKVGKKVKDLTTPMVGVTEAAGGMAQLSCESCHQLDAGRAVGGDESKLFALLGGQSKEAVRPPRAAGAYYLPVNFDMHCKACHPLTVSGAVTGDGAAKTFAIDVPHRKQPAELKEFVTAAVAGKLLGEGKVSELPTASFLRQNPAGKSADTTSLKATLTAAVDKATQAAAGTCGQCHTIQADKSVQPVRIPTVWFEHARFDHTAHRGVGCAECHPTAYSSDDKVRAIREAKDQSWEKEGVHIEGVASCKKCHSPAETRTIDGRKVLAGGVRHGCTDCHSYHNGDHPLQGPGSPLQAPKPELTIDQFLLGGLAPTTK